MKARGDYIDGSFLPPEGDSLVSVNPARGGQPVLETAHSPARATLAADAADTAAAAWRRLDADARFAHLCRFRDALAERKEALAEAILLETGKIRSEARAEAGALISRFDIARAHILSDLAEKHPAPGERLRYQALGTIAVIGPFNFPLHLCHAHAVPALLTGNTVVIKPSDLTPLCAQVYAEAADAARLPAGVLNIVIGGAASARALCAHPAVRGVCFTGSYAVGRAIQEALLDRPEVLLALEMGGKNTAVVLDDADVRQAAHEIVCGANLTAGQRCTATDRVIVSRDIAAPLTAALERLVAALAFGDPDDAQSFAGPITTRAGAQKVAAACAAAREGGARALVAGGVRDDGFFTDPSLHILPEGHHHIAGYTDIELFGPDIALSIARDDDEILEALARSPYGFANSVFTASDARFERFFTESRAGILNRNRSTNQASPSLPFGGIGQSGNYRPAGAHAQRNVTYPVATKARVLGAIDAHPKLVRALPEPALDDLDARHEAEEAAEMGRTLLGSPRPMTVLLPAGGKLPASQALLDRLEAERRVPREKKPLVIDHLRSAGPYMVSIDERPMSVLDGMSQTATVCGGFAEDPVVRAYVEGEFGRTTLRAEDTARPDAAEAEKLATVLRHLVPGLPHVSFTNSGAEANEKALALCRAHADPQKTRVLAFEGSFHGRTLLALHATYSPKKRAPFEIGKLATFAPYPVWKTPRLPEPSAPAGFYAACAAADTDALARHFADPDEDPLLAAEVASLLFCARAAGDVYACIIEPMQSEGGDRYATARFYRALRLLTRALHIPLIFDEVQTGFGLGQSFAWHERFQLVNARGQRDFPDAVTFAKRAQVGVCMSRFEDPEPTPTSAASLIRGRIHAEMMSTAHQASRVQELVWPRLEALAQAFPDLCRNPRAEGYALAFDLPTPDHLKAYLGQRFWRGAVVFGAGDRTVRYRLSDAYQAREVDALFVTIRRSLAYLEAHPGKMPPAWEDFPASKASFSATGESSPDIEIQTVRGEKTLALLEPILDIERRVYEPARQTAPEHIRAALEHPEGIVTVAEADGQLVGFALGVPLEDSADEGPDRDPMLGRKNSLYSVSLTVVPEAQGRGLGRRIKDAQLREAAARKNPDGSPRYLYVTGRNRIGHTARMTHLNRVFGAHVVCVLTGQYEDPEGQALYYRIPVGPLAPAPGTVDAGDKAGVAIDCSGIQRPLSRPPASLVRAEEQGLLYGPAVNKLTLVNYATPAVVRAMEHVSALYPELPHLYLSSGRDEAIDKAIRLCRYHRREATVAIALDQGYVGHTTACARSLSDPSTHRQGDGPFSWPRVPHPAAAGIEATIAAIESAVEAAGGAASVLALIVESVQERTGHSLDSAAWQALAALRDRLGIPLVCVDTAGACYRSGHAAFASRTLGAAPEVCVWWGGGQTGYLHVAPKLFVSAPLTLVSTWDGDELSLIREHHQLREARKLAQRGALVAAVEALDGVAARFSAAGIACPGRGLYRVAHAGDRAENLAEALAARGLAVGRLPGGRLVFAPPLDIAEAAGQKLAAALDDLL